MELLSPSINKLFGQVAIWFGGLKSRERWMVLGLVAVLVLIGVQHSLIVYLDHKASIRERIATAESDLQWLETQRLIKAQLQQQGAARLDRQELLATVTAIAEQMNIKVTLVAREGDLASSLRLEWRGVNPSSFMTYLSALVQRGVSISQLEIKLVRGSSIASVEVEG